MSLLLRPGSGAEYCDQPVCLSVCLSASISLEPLDRSSRNFVVQIRCARGLVLLWRRCATLCISGFMDDVTFGRIGRDAGKGWQHSVLAINYVRDRGRSLMSMNACLNLNLI